VAIFRDIIVVGASAGGVEALKQLVSYLPPDLPAAVFAVLHISPWTESLLPKILDHTGTLPAQHPVSGQRFWPGNIYVAPPDQHMLLEKDTIRLWRGPKENLHRPAVNPLFRSAAVYYKERVTGVVLSGARDDGSAGLWWIKEFGGLALVQEPKEAAFADMPQSAIEHVAVDYVAPVAGLARILTEAGEEADTVRKKSRR
jgi:two-component system chemotaxis response regulator CheB